MGHPHLFDDPIVQLSGRSDARQHQRNSLSCRNVSSPVNFGHVHVQQDQMYVLSGEQSIELLAVTASPRYESAAAREQCEVSRNCRIMIGDKQVGLE